MHRSPACSRPTLPQAVHTGAESGQPDFLRNDVESERRRPFYIRVSSFQSGTSLRGTFPISRRQVVLLLMRCRKSERG